VQRRNSDKGNTLDCVFSFERLNLSQASFDGGKAPLWVINYRAAWSEARQLYPVMTDTKANGRRGRNRPITDIAA
jgi:hypothetical protein